MCEIIPHDAFLDEGNEKEGNQENQKEREEDKEEGRQHDETRNQ